MRIVYKITNTITGKIYIGSTAISIAKRWEGHLDSRWATPHLPLYRDILWYGEDKFKIEEIKKYPCSKKGYEGEVFWTSVYAKYFDLYNTNNKNRPFHRNGRYFKSFISACKKVKLEAENAKRIIPPPIPKRQTTLER